MPHKFHQRHNDVRCDGKSERGVPIHSDLAAMYMVQSYGCMLSSSNSYDTFDNAMSRRALVSKLKIHLNAE